MTDLSKAFDCLSLDLLIAKVHGYMFLTSKTPYFTGYADDNIPFAVRDKITDVIKALEEIK